jgi:hypothetical protein
MAAAAISATLCDKVSVRGECSVTVEDVVRRNSSAAGLFFVLALNGTLLTGCGSAARATSASSNPSTLPRPLEARVAGHDEFCVKALSTERDPAQWSASCFARLDREDRAQRARAPASEAREDGPVSTTCTRHGDTAACRTSR